MYEEKILTLFKSKINLKKKHVTIAEAEKIISDFNNSSEDISAHSHDHDHDHDHDQNHKNETKNNKEKKTNKTSSNNKKKTKKVSKK